MGETGANKIYTFNARNNHIWNFVRRKFEPSPKRFYDRIWGEYYVADDRDITAYINKIRKKIEPDQSNPIYIQTVWDVGYKFNEKIG